MITEKVEAVLLDFGVLFDFKKRGFCGAFIREATKFDKPINDEKLSDIVHGILFRSELESQCSNEGITTFEELFERAYTNIPDNCRSNKKREELYGEFVRLWNAFLLENSHALHLLVEGFTKPIALLCITNPPHCEKVKGSDFAKTIPLATYISHPCENNKDRKSIIRCLAKELKIHWKHFLYLGNYREHEKAAHELGMGAIHYESDMNTIIDIRRKLVREYQVI